MDTCGHGVSHPFRCTGAVEKGLTGIKKNALVKCLVLFPVGLNLLGFLNAPTNKSGPSSSVGIATDYGMDGI